MTNTSARSAFIPGGFGYSDLMADSVLLSATNTGGEFIDARSIEGFYDMDEDSMANALANADGVFIPCLARGGEDALARLSMKLGKPLVIWSPPDIGAGVAAEFCRELALYGVPFSYIRSTGADDAPFIEGMRDHFAACRAKKLLSGMRMLVIGDAPGGHESGVGSSLGVTRVKLDAKEFVSDVRLILEKQGADWAATRAMIMRKIDCSRQGAQSAGMIAAMKLAIMYSCQQSSCEVSAMDCREVGGSLGVSPCAAIGLLADEGSPVACSLDVTGAVTIALLRAITGGQSPILFGELASMHPTDKNGFLYRNCGAFPPSFADGAPALFSNAIMDNALPGCGGWRMKDGRLTLCRIDDANGGAKMLFFDAKSIDGRDEAGTYMWLSTEKRILIEDELIRGCHGSRFAAVYSDVTGALRETARFIKDLECEDLSSGSR